MNILRQLIYFWGEGGGVRVYDKEKIRNRPGPITFYDFVLEQIPHDKTYVFSAFQSVHVVSEQPLHRWLVVSSFHICRIVSPKFQQGDTEIYKFCE